MNEKSSKASKQKNVLFKSFFLFENTSLHINDQVKIDENCKGLMWIMSMECKIVIRLNWNTYVYFRIS